MCNRLGILVAGCLRCIGSVQHLKSRFGAGYVLLVHAAGEPPRLQEAEALVRGACSGAELQERDVAGGRLAFVAPQQGLDLPAVFEALEHGRGSGSVAEYSIGQTTLEQVFIEMSRESHGAE